jgi:hypothetical protein
MSALDQLLPIGTSPSRAMSASPHWKVGRLLALQDAVDVVGGTSELIDRIRPVED